MKYMTFNSSCSFAGIANMLERMGYAYEDYQVAAGMELPYIVARDNGGYIAGAMLQEKKYFDIFLKKIGYELTEEKISRQKVFSYLKETKSCAMLGIKIDEKHKHAVVYTGNDGDVLLFINNKHRESDEPCEMRLDEGELLQRLDEVTVVASLKPYEGGAVNPLPYFVRASIKGKCFKYSGYIVPSAAS